MITKLMACAQRLQRGLALGLAISAAAITSCGTRGDARQIEAGERAVGSVQLSLVTPEQDQFRLRGASFDVSRRGAAVVTLDSESDPDATSLEADLDQGSYEMSLRDGWRLERLGDAGAATPVSAALLTPNPLPFDVLNARVTELAYAFTTERGTVIFGRGAASVRIDVATTVPAGSCSVLDRSSCASGQTCLLAGDGTRSYCAEPGSLPVGSPCSSDQCVAGAQCLGLNPERPDERTCARFCDTSSNFCGCQALSIGNDIGICTAASAPGLLFSHDFVPGSSPAACSEWNAFRGALGNDVFGRVTLSGSLDGRFECTDPVVATQICRGLRDNLFVNRFCQGRNWTVADCGGGVELSVDTPWCSCFRGNVARPCNGSYWGGVGTDTCSPPAQTIEVTCEGASDGPPSVCGNGEIESYPLFSGVVEVCDTNGEGPDVLPPTASPGSTCSPDCMTIAPSAPLGCLLCAQTRCPTQYANSIGAESSPQNLAEVTQLFDCVIGPNWELGGHIPQTSCFFADPVQPMGSLLPCYCGNTPQATCLATGPANNQDACGLEIELASDCNPVTASCVTSSGSNPAVPLGDVLLLLSCERAACGPECGFPPPVEE